MMDPDFYDDDEGCWEGMEEETDPEEYVYDTFDHILDTNDPVDDDDPGPDYELDHMDMAMAFALSDEIRDAERKNYDIDENTDGENWEKAEKLAALSTRHKRGRKLKPFEQYISDICEGRRPLFKGKLGDT